MDYDTNANMPNRNCDFLRKGSQDENESRNNVGPDLQEEDLNCSIQTESHELSEAALSDSEDDKPLIEIARKIANKSKCSARCKKSTERLLKMQEEKREQSYKALKYLLNESQMYTTYIEERFQNAKVSKSKNGNDLDDISDFDLLVNAHKSSDNAENSKMNFKIAQPDLFVNGTLRDYQLEGVEWLKFLFENGVNGILADEMGLGKTVQVIGFICYLYSKGIVGPFLICAPLSTIPNWLAEFERFAPKLPVLLLHGDKAKRGEVCLQMKRKNYIVDDFKTCSPIVISSYDGPKSEFSALSKCVWKYIIVDEGHRLKNHKCDLFKRLSSFHSINRLLLTGTPLQNNLRELWSLLHFLLPAIFNDFEIFESWIDLDDLKNDSEKFLKQEQEKHILGMVHGILKPFMLRRQKTDVKMNLPPKKEVLVYCPMTAKQRSLYKYVLEKNIEALQNPNGKSVLTESNHSPIKRCRKTKTYKEDSSDEEFSYEGHDASENRFPIQERETITSLTMQNSATMFRKIVNHPYLVHFPLIRDPSNPKSKPRLCVDENLILQSGKMMMLEAMAARLIETGHKILIFSTLTSMLDLIEEMLIMKKYNYRRLDGTMSLHIRQEAMKSFNDDPCVKIFIISTRAGGLGLNLVAADTVILYDSDWNPQVDIQAQDRCHRIGQTRPVMVFQFVTRGTIDEQIVTTGEKKRKLEKLIIRSDKFKLHSRRKDHLSELENLKTLLTEDDKQIMNSVGQIMSSAELDELLDRTDLLNQMQESNNGQ